MRSKTTLERLLDVIGTKEAKAGLSKLTPELTKKRYIEELRQFKSSIKIVTD